MKRFLNIALLFLCVGLQANAQKFLDDLTKERQGEGKVTVSESAEIDELVNGKEPPAAKVPAAAGSTSSEAETKKPEPAVRQETSASATTSDVVDTRKKVMTNSHKVNGYRVQVFSGGNTRADRVKAEQIQGAMKAAFPGQPVYTHFYSPRWICRMGNFKTYAEAEKILKQVKAMGYPQAVIVKGKISVAY